MKFYKALGKIIESEIKTGISVLYMINTDWNGLSNNKVMSVNAKYKQEDAYYNMCPYLEIVIETEMRVDCVPWIPSFLDIFSDKWVVMKYNTKTGKEEIVR